MSNEQLHDVCPLPPRCDCTRSECVPNIVSGTRIGPSYESHVFCTSKYLFQPCAGRPMFWAHIHHLQAPRCQNCRMSGCCHALALPNCTQGTAACARSWHSTQCRYSHLICNLMNATATLHCRLALSGMRDVCYSPSLPTMVSRLSKS
jgi:hypothetical protein